MNGEGDNHTDSQDRHILSLFQLIWSLCKRPKLYTLNGDSGEIWAFILGIDSISYSFIQSGIKYPLARFGRWLAERFDIEFNVEGDSSLKLCLSQRDIFNSQSNEEIWELFAAYYIDCYGVAFEPLHATTCGFSND